MEYRYNKIKDLKVSNYVNIEESGNIVRIKILRPLANMQTDFADFEAISIIYKCINPNVKVIIEFDILGEDIPKTEKWNRKFGNRNSEVNTYLRFLFRLYMFEKAFGDWVEVAQRNKEEKEYFESLYEKAIKEKKVTNNFPGTESSYNEKKGEEHVIEKILTQTSKGKEYLEEMYNKMYPNDSLKCMYDKLPNGLFNIEPSGEPRKDNRIFTSGAYDIWGIDDKNNFCIFELKKNKGNAGLGVISELFFYATFAQKILCNPERINSKGGQNSFRGYNKLYEFITQSKVNEIRAIFLLGEGIHPAIKEMYERGELTNILNKNKFNIKFNLLQYDFNKVKDLKEKMRNELNDIKNSREEK